MEKRLISLALVFVMLLSMLPVSALATEATPTEIVEQVEATEEVAATEEEAPVEESTPTEENVSEEQSTPTEVAAVTDEATATELATETEVASETILELATETEVAPLLEKAPQKAEPTHTDAVYSTVPVDYDVFLNADTSLGYPGDQLAAAVEEELQNLANGCMDTDSTFRVRSNGTVIDTTDQSTWYVYDHYDTAYHESEDAWKEYFCISQENEHLRPYQEYTEYEATSGTDATKLAGHLASLSSFTTVGKLDQHIYSYAEDGKAAMLFAENGSPGYCDFLFYPTTSVDRKTVTFSVDSQYMNIHTLLGAGFLVNAGIDADGYIHGYVLYYRAGGNQGFGNGTMNSVSLYKINNGVKASYFSNYSGSMNNEDFVTCIWTKTLEEGEWENQMDIRLTITPEAIQIEQKASNEEEFLLKGSVAMTSTGYHGFGPLVQYDSHGCSDNSTFLFSNLTMVIGTPREESTSAMSPIYNAEYVASSSNKVFVNLLDNKSEYSSATDSNEEDLTILKGLRDQRVRLLTNNDKLADTVVEECMGKNAVGLEGVGTKTLSEMAKAIAVEIYGKVFQPDYGTETDAEEAPLTLRLEADGISDISVVINALLEEEMKIRLNVGDFQGLTPENFTIFPSAAFAVSTDSNGFYLTLTDNISDFPSGDYLITVTSGAQHAQRTLTIAPSVVYGVVGVAARVQPMYDENGFKSVTLDDAENVEREYDSLLFMGWMDQDGLLHEAGSRHSGSSLYLMPAFQLPKPQLNGAVSRNSISWKRIKLSSTETVDYYKVEFYQWGNDEPIYVATTTALSAEAQPEVDTMTAGYAVVTAYKEGFVKNSTTSRNLGGILDEMTQDKLDEVFGSGVAELSYNDQTDTYTIKLLQNVMVENPVDFQVAAKVVLDLNKKTLSGLSGEMYNLMHADYYETCDGKDAIILTSGTDLTVKNGTIRGGDGLGDGEGGDAIIGDTDGIFYSAEYQRLESIIEDGNMEDLMALEIASGTTVEEFIASFDTGALLASVTNGVDMSILETLLNEETVVNTDVVNAAVSSVTNGLDGMVDYAVDTVKEVVKYVYLKYLHPGLTTKLTVESSAKLLGGDFGEKHIAQATDTDDSYVVGSGFSGVVDELNIKGATIRLGLAVANTVNITSGSKVTVGNYFELKLDEDRQDDVTEVVEGIVSTVKSIVSAIAPTVSADLENYIPAVVERAFNGDNTVGTGALVAGTGGLNIESNASVVVTSDLFGLGSVMGDINMKPGSKVEIHSAIGPVSLLGDVNYNTGVVNDSLLLGAAALMGDVNINRDTAFSSLFKDSKGKNQTVAPLLGMITLLGDVNMGTNGTIGSVTIPGQLISVLNIAGHVNMDNVGTVNFGTKNDPSYLGIISLLGDVKTTGKQSTTVNIYSRIQAMITLIGDVTMNKGTLNIATSAAGENALIGMFLLGGNVELNSGAALNCNAGVLGLIQILGDVNGTNAGSVSINANGKHAVSSYLDGMIKDMLGTNTNITPSIGAIVIVGDINTPAGKTTDIKGGILGLLHIVGRVNNSGTTNIYGGLLGDVSVLAPIRADNGKVTVSTGKIEQILGDEYAEMVNEFAGELGLSLPIAVLGVGNINTGLVAPTNGMGITLPKKNAEQVLINFGEALSSLYAAASGTDLSSYAEMAASVPYVGEMIAGMLDGQTVNTLFPAEMAEGVFEILSNYGAMIVMDEQPTKDGDVLCAANVTVAPVGQVSVASVVLQDREYSKRETVSGTDIVSVVLLDGDGDVVKGLKRGVDYELTVKTVKAGRDTPVTVMIRKLSKTNNFSFTKSTYLRVPRASVVLADVTYYDGLTGEKLYEELDQQLGITVVAPASLTDWEHGGMRTITKSDGDHNYYFRGWRTGSSPIAKEWKFDTENYEITEDLNLYSTWVEKTYSVGGNVRVTPTDAISSDTTVILKRGNVVVASTKTNAQGEYEFNDVTPGLYNVVASSTNVIKTAFVQIVATDAMSTNIYLPSGGYSSVLTVKDDGETPEVIVAGLDSLALQLAEDLSSDTDTLKVEMVVAATGTDATSSDALDMVFTVEDDKQEVDYLDVVIEKTVNDAPAGLVTETNSVMEIIIHYDMTDKYDLRVNRLHNGEVEVFQQNMSRSEGTFYIEGSGADAILHIFANKFSVYAVIYNVQAAAAPSSNRSHNKGNKTFFVEDDDINEVKIDGVVLDKKYYTVDKGAVTIHADYLKMLGNGKYTVTMSSTATGKSQTVEAVKTGDMGVMLYVGMAGVSYLSGAYFIRKRKQEDEEA